MRVTWSETCDVKHDDDAENDGELLEHQESSPDVGWTDFGNVHRSSGREKTDPDPADEASDYQLGVVIRSSLEYTAEHEP